MLNHVTSISSMRAMRNGIKTLFLIGLISAISGLVTPVQTASASSKKETIAAISNHFAKVPTMTGEFIQFGPNGEQTGGQFYLQRPGKIRFNYEKPSTVQVISNGRTVAVNNTKLKTWSFYPLRNTPLKLLLDDRIDIGNSAIRNVSTEDDITTVVMGDKQVFGDSEITLLFDPESHDLRQWTIKDAQGKETSVMIFNVQKNVKIPVKYFVVNEAGIRQRKSLGAATDR